MTTGYDDASDPKQPSRFDAYPLDFRHTQQLRRGRGNSRAGRCRSRWSTIMRLRRPCGESRLSSSVTGCGLRLLTLDGTTFDVADTPANQAAFGRPGGGRGQGAFPQVRLLGLVEGGTPCDRGCGHGRAASWGELAGAVAWALAGAGDAAAGRPGPVRPGAVAQLAGNRGGAGVALPSGRQAAGACGVC